VHGNCHREDVLKLKFKHLLKLYIMEDSLKKFLYAGVDLAAEASSKLEDSVKGLVAKGKISEAEGKKMVDDLFEKTENAKTEFEAKYKEVKERVGITKKSDDEVLAELKQKVADLESKVGKPAAAKKPVAAKA
jgi:polyhydroxyalkanoate synthesis regulator phasin